MTTTSNKATHTWDGVEIRVGLVAFDNNLTLVVVADDGGRDGWFRTIRIGGHGQGRAVGSSDASRLSTTFQPYEGPKWIAATHPREVEPEIALRSGQNLWTLVTIQPRARFARPVAGAVVGTWHEASAQMDGRDWNLADGTEVWVVTAEGVLPPEHEDADNILRRDKRGRWHRTPIKWDAKPRLAI